MPFRSHISQWIEATSGRGVTSDNTALHNCGNLWRGWKLKTICGSSPSNQDNKYFSEGRSGKYITNPNADLQKLDFLNIGWPQHHSLATHSCSEHLLVDSMEGGVGKRHFHDLEGIAASHTNMKSIKVYSRGTSPCDCTHIFLKTYCIRHPFLFGLTTAPALHIDV